MRIFRKLFVCFSISFIFLLAGCASLARPELSAEEEALLYPVEMYVPEVFEWQKVSDDNGVVPGIWRYDFANPDLPLIYHAVKIDLGSSENAGADDTALFTLAASQWERTSDFAARENCILAMNATPFDRTKLAGLYKLGGKFLSEPIARYAALGLQCDKDGAVVQARIFESQTDEELADWNSVFGGFFVVLRDGQVCTEFVRRYTARSGAGISADGKTLYLLVVEGERPRQSLGLSYPQCGEIFLAMGCSDALEFDGGGSSDLCINGQSVMNYRVRRVQGNSFGFRVK